MYRIALILSLSLFAASCGGRRSRPQQTACVPQPRVFLPAIAPARLSPQEQRDYLRWHYWDRFDFADTLFVREADTVQMVEAYARWVALIFDRPADAAPMDSLMRRASASRPMLDYFTMLAQQVIHDPNSPLRNDEFFIPVMQAVLASPYYDEYERIGPAYDLAMASQNRLGQRANDFRYTLASGATGTLYGVKAEYTLLFINNPGCAMCKQLREQIAGSPMLSEMIERGRLKILALYPDEDLTEWRNYRDHIPASWINAYDAGCLVRENGTYDLTAIPSLYLLDSDKRVLVKDSTDVPYIEEVIDRRGEGVPFPAARFLRRLFIPFFSALPASARVHMTSAISVAYRPIKKDNRDFIRILCLIVTFALHKQKN